MKTSEVDRIQKNAQPKGETEFSLILGTATMPDPN